MDPLQKVIGTDYVHHHPIAKNRWYRIRASRSRRKKYTVQNTRITAPSLKWTVRTTRITAPSQKHTVQNTRIIVRGQKVVAG